MTTKLFLLFCVLFLLVGMICQAKDKPQLLPENFAGWQKTSDARVSPDPFVADPANGSLMKEYGFSDYESAVYTRGQRKIAVKAARFEDSSGAYGAFTLYRQPNMQTESIGDLAASADNHVLVFRSNILVDVVLDRVTAMSASELRSLSEELPQPPANASKMPVLPQYLPRQSLIKNSDKFVIGPVGLEKTRAPLHASQINFSAGAEVALASYTTSLGSSTLMVISYPTPQIAAADLRNVLAWHDSLPRLNPLPPSASPSSSNPDLQNVVMLSGEFQAKRSGPLLVVVAGEVSPREAKSLLASVNYDADVTWNEDAHMGPKDNVGAFLLGVFTLIAVIIFITLVAGVAFGGIRVISKRLFPSRIFDRPEDVEFIQLKLNE